MSRIAAPMVGGMVTAPLMSLFVVAAANFLKRRRSFVHAIGSSSKFHVRSD